MGLRIRHIWAGKGFEGGFEVDLECGKGEGGLEILMFDEVEILDEFIFILNILGYDNI